MRKARTGLCYLCDYLSKCPVDAKTIVVYKIKCYSCDTVGVVCLPPPSESTEVPFCMYCRSEKVVVMQHQVG